MSIQHSFDESTAPSVYQHLLSLHQSDDFDSKLDSWNSLPESFRQSLFESISEQAGRPSDLDYAKANVPTLQQAVAKVAIQTFQTFSQKEKDIVAYKIWEHAGKPYSRDKNWGENHAADNISILLKTMHDSLGDLTPELQKIDEHAVCSYLASREDWINALKVQYSERRGAIDEENYQELEAAGEEQEKLDQLETNQKQRWEALTAWSLASMDPQWSHNNNP